MSAPMTTDQDVRQLRNTKFPPEFDVKVDTSKVNIPVIKKWVSDETARILGFDDDILTEMVFGFIDDTSHPDIKMLQIQLSGFLKEKTPQFCLALWKMCISAQESPQGIPKQLLEAKKMELINEKMQEDKARAEAKERQESVRQREDDLSHIRHREREERSDRNGRSAGYRRDNRGYTRESFRPISRSRSPVQRRRNGDNYYREPPRRGTDSYVPSRGRNDSRRRSYRRSPSYSRSPSTPPRRRRRPRRSPSRSRSRTPPRRRRRSTPGSTESRSPSPRRRDRASPSSPSRSRSRSRSVTPQKRKRAHSPPHSRSRSRSRSLSRSRGHGSHHKSRHGRRGERKHRSRSSGRRRNRSRSPKRSRGDPSRKREHRDKYSRSRSPSLKRRRRRSHSSSSVESRHGTRDLIVTKDNTRDKARLSREPSEHDEDMSAQQRSRSSSATAE